MSIEELDELKALSKKFPIIGKAWDELDSIYGDPTKYFYLQLSQTVKALSKEMEFIRNGQKELCFLIGSDDKTFERVTKLAIDSDKIFAGLRKGKEDIDPEGAKKQRESEKEYKGSLLDLQADEKRKKL